MNSAQKACWDEETKSLIKETENFEQKFREHKKKIIQDDINAIEERKREFKKSRVEEVKHFSRTTPLETKKKFFDNYSENMKKFKNDTNLLKLKEQILDL